MPNNPLIKPLITEKSMRDAAQNRYTFAVQKAANKSEIAQAIAAGFGVKVLGVKTITIKGTAKRAGKTRREIVASPWKKAVATVEKGQKIDLFDATEKEPHA